MIMKRIDLVKYGFTRTPEADFSDDGNRFTCYGLGRIRVSKLVDRGEVYIAASIINNSKLIYEEYSKLPCFEELDRLNGVNVADITEEDLQRFYNSCITYIKAYEEAERNADMPTYDEIYAVLSQIKKVRNNELNEITNRLTIDKLFALNQYDLGTFQRYYKSLKSYAEEDMEVSAKRSVGGYRSKQILKASYLQSESRPSFYYEQLVKLLDSVEKK